MSRVGQLLQEEGAIPGLRSLVGRAVRKAATTGNASAHGWRSGRLPLGSTIIGTRRISVGSGFDAAQPVWIEAVTTFAGEVHNPSIAIGERFSTSGRLHVSAIERVEIGDDCLFGSNVYVGDHGHGELSGPTPSSPDMPPRARPLRGRGPIRIGSRVWLGDHVVVLGGVTIGDGAVVGANAVVTRDVPADAVAVGIPARVVKRFDRGSGTYRSTEPADA